MISIRTRAEISAIREACRIVVGAFRAMESLMVPGTLTIKIDEAVEKYIRRQNAWPAFKGYPNPEGKPFPASACISIEEEVVHGIPGTRLLKAGQIVGVDIGVEKEGFFGDAAVTFAVGAVDELRRRLMQAAREALAEGIAKARAGNRLSDISHAIESHVGNYGFSVVRELVGHGVGRKLHEEPQIPNFGPPGRGPLLRENMVFAIEPMVNAGTGEVETIGDWRVVSKDRSPSAHFEHTVVVKNGEADLLTAP
ncbi:MAG: type I methionyl aminopeptidase [bacterium]